MKKLGSDASTVFVYDAMGKLAAEYGTVTPGGCGRCYLTADALGSTRMVTDSSGAVLSRYDYLPFGEGLLAGNFERTTGQKYGLGSGDPNTVRFTGKERDVETGLDYFEARYMSAAQGRFTSPDPGNAGAFASNPQSWNAYSYVVNNPLKYTDPHGLSYQVCEADGNNCANISDEEFEKFRKTKDLNFRGGSSGSIYAGNTRSGTFRQTDFDLTSPTFMAVTRGMRQAAPVVNAVAAVTLGFVAVAGGAGIVGLVADSGVTLIPGLAPNAEYTSAVRALDALGEANPGAVLNPTQARALAQNVVDVLNITIPNSLARGDARGVQSVINQLANPRFNFLNQIPGPLKEALVQGAARLGVIVK